MTHGEIECFLAIYRYKTITLAAERLFITQPSLSARLKTLEKELGGPLFNRKKGNREMELTAAGKEFYQLAVQYEAIINQMKQVCKNKTNTIRVSAINSVSTYFLPKVYNSFMLKHPEYQLEIQDMELDAATKGILEGSTDLAFTSGKSTDDRLIQIPVFLEKMVLVVGDGLQLGPMVTTENLKNNNEIYVEWSHAYNIWHKQSFKGDHPQITISIMSQLEQFMLQNDCWAIVPVSIANKLVSNSLLKIVNTAFDIPKREISVVKAFDNNSEIVKEFLEAIKKVTNEASDVYSLL